MPKYYIVDVGIGNIQSVRNWLNRFGIYSIEQNFKKISSEDFIIVPGVADAGKLLTEIERSGIREKIEKHIGDSGKVLGICAGMQIFYEYLEEGKRNGIGYFKGPVVKINPHNGWEPIELHNINSIKKFNVSRLKKISGRMYFNHQYAACESSEDVASEVLFDSIRLSNVVCRGTVVGVQAHPEKSQKMGLDFLKLLVKR